MAYPPPTTSQDALTILRETLASYPYEIPTSFQATTRAQFKTVQLHVAALLAVQHKRFGVSSRRDVRTLRRVRRMGILRDVEVYLMEGVNSETRALIEHECALGQLPIVQVDEKGDLLPKKRKRGRGQRGGRGHAN